jgi:hypothetical protein
MSSARRFPPPWTAEVTPNCFMVRDANGQALSYVCYESEPGRRSAAKLLSEDDERWIAANIAKLPSCFIKRIQEAEVRWRVINSSSSSLIETKSTMAPMPVLAMLLADSGIFIFLLAKNI